MRASNNKFTANFQFSGVLWTQR